MNKPRSPIERLVDASVKPTRYGQMLECARAFLREFGYTEAEMRDDSVKHLADMLAMFALRHTTGEVRR